MHFKRHNTFDEILMQTWYSMKLTGKKLLENFRPNFHWR